MLRVRLYPGYSYRRILLEQARTHTRARDGESGTDGKRRVESAGNARRGARREGEAHREEHMECT